MASTFNLLTAGGARFNKQRFRDDIDLFSKKQSSRKGKERATVALPVPLDFFHDHSHPRSPTPSASEGEDEDSEEEGTAPPKQKITLTGAEPLPKSLHSNLPSLVSHPSHELPSTSGEPLLRSLRASNIHSLWGVQCAVAGCLLDGRDVMCIAPTGSGKTLSYLLPTLVSLRDPARTITKGSEDSGEGHGVRSVVLVPTHDLAVQISGVCKAVTGGRKWRVMVLSKATERAVCESAPGKNFGKGEKGDVERDGDGDEGVDDGEESTGSTNEFGVSDGEDEEDEEEEIDSAAGNGNASKGLGIDILIATPERLHHLIQNKQLHLKDTRHLILDESDRLLSEDFRPQVMPILKAASHPAVQKCFLSATMPSGAEEIARKWLRDGGVRVVVGLKDSAVSTVSQSLLYTASEPGKLLALRNLVSSGQLPYPSLIFVQSITRAEELTKTLILDGLRVDSVHGNRTPAQRDKAVSGFREGSVWVLVVTEVLARGMDFRGVKVVVNYDFPQTVQSYIHRIGRTGRAGRPGTAITFFSDEDGPYLRTIANVLQSSGCEVPAYMLEMKKPSKNLKRFRAKVPVKRKEVGGGGRDVARERGKRRREMVEASKRRRTKGKQEAGLKESNEGERE